MKWDGTIWERGQKRKIALVGSRIYGTNISEQHFSDIIHRIRQAGPNKAKALEAASVKVLGEENKIQWEEFLESRKSENEYFIGEPKI
jgi:hypothetical protein